MEESDEHFAWKAALVIMGVFSIIALGFRGLALWGVSGYTFFTPEFEVSLVYIPTIVLLVGWRVQRPSSVKA